MGRLDFHEQKNSMTKLIYGEETLKPTSTWGAYGNHGYNATKLMVEGKSHKIFITPQARDDILEGYKDGFVLQINGKSIGCYWLYYYGCNLSDKEKYYHISLYENGLVNTELGKKVWLLDEIGIEPSMSSTNQFTTHRYFDSYDEMMEGIEFIREVFSEYDGNEHSEKINDEVVMIWTKKIPAEIHFSLDLQNKIDNGELIGKNVD